MGAMSFKYQERYVLEFQNGEVVTNAGSKAPKDISAILANNGFTSFYIKTDCPGYLKKITTVIHGALVLFRIIPSKSLLVVQYPIYSKQGQLCYRLFSFLCIFKKLTKVAVVHDVQFMRTCREEKKK